VRGDKKHGISRRTFLKGGALLAVSTLVGDYDQSSAQVTPPTAPSATAKRIYIAPDDHTDYFWSADEDTYRQAFLDMLDYYLDLADRTANEQPDYQSRWACDGSLWMWTYEKNKSQADFERLISRIRDGHISIPLNALCVCLGAVPAEAVLRGMYYPGQIERRYDIRFSLAYMIENQTQPYGVASLWAGSGAKYSWKGICACDGIAGTSGFGIGEREHEIYWWVGPDGSRILTKWYSFIDHNSIGGYAEGLNPRQAITIVDTNIDFRSRYPYNVIGIFGEGHDALKTLKRDFVDVAKQMTTASRRVIVSNEEDFFEDFEATYGANLPSVSCTFGNEWDIYCAELAEVSARVKRAVEKLRSAEALATLVSLRNPSFMAGRQEARDLAWMDLGLFWEHDFGMVYGTVGPKELALTQKRIDWQRRLASEIETYVNALYTDASSALGSMIEKTGSASRFYVFNPLSWTRTDFADLPYSDSASIHVIDLSTGLETPSQIVTVDGQRYLRILAKDLPPVGYKVFEARPGAGSNFGNAASISGNVMESAFYRITVANRGAITSLIDKTRTSREFVRTINQRVMNDLGPGPGALAAENIGPVSVTLCATSSSPLSHTTRITLIRDSRRIDIRNEIDQNFNDTFTWAYGFDLAPSNIWHEEVGAVILAKLLEHGGHYSPRNARYDWLTLNHFADISNGTLGMTLSNADCYFMKLGNSSDTTTGDGQLDEDTPQIQVLVGGREGGAKLPGTGIFNQGGDTHFLQRFALQTHDAYNPVAAMKFALEHQNPLVTGIVTGGSGYPEASYSLVTVSDPNVLLWALKPAEEGIGRGIIARVWNLSTSPTSFSLGMLSGPIFGAWHTTHIETPLEGAIVTNGALSASLAANQLKTFLLKIDQP
jgi:alpha-mannosidase